MDRWHKKLIFLIGVFGGILFAIPFYLVFFTANGFSWKIVLISVAIAAAFSVIFYFVWMMIEDFVKPFSIENPKAQKRLADYEKKRARPYELRVEAYVNHGKGLKEEFCETVMYFEKSKLHIAFYHFGKIKSFDILYKNIETAFIHGEILVIDAKTYGSSSYCIKKITPELREILISKGLCDDSIRVSMGELFITNDDRSGYFYYEIQYCKSANYKKKLERGLHFWKKESIYVDMDNEQEFFENYYKYLRISDYVQNGGSYDKNGVNYYSAQRAAKILDDITVDKPRDYDVFAAWLEKAAYEYEGFFILGL